MKIPPLTKNLLYVCKVLSGAWYTLAHVMFIKTCGVVHINCWRNQGCMYTVILYPKSVFFYAFKDYFVLVPFSTISGGFPNLVEYSEYNSPLYCLRIFISVWLLNCDTLTGAQVHVCPCPECPGCALFCIPPCPFLSRWLGLCVCL